MTTSYPMVSVIVVCDDVAAYLKEVVQSVLDQTFQDFEIIVVNLGSPDPETAKLLAAYRRPKTRVVLQKDNAAFGAAYNFAIENSLGRYICILGAHDRLAPSFLEKATAILEANDSAVFVSCWLCTFGMEDRLWKQDRCDLPVLLAESMAATATVVRKRAVLDVGGYDEHMPAGYEAWDLCITLVERGFQGVTIPEVLFYHRLRQGTTVRAQLPLIQHLISKHETSYRQYLLEVLLQQEAARCELLKATYALYRQIESGLVPRIEHRRAELARLQRKLQAIEPDSEARVAKLEKQLAHARGEVESLSAALASARNGIAHVVGSRSWQVTAPLRAVYDLLQRNKQPKSAAPTAAVPLTTNESSDEPKDAGGRTTQ